jgi:hypothetical protein
VNGKSRLAASQCGKALPYRSPPHSFRGCAADCRKTKTIQYLMLGSGVAANST